MAGPICNCQLSCSPRWADARAHLGLPVAQHHDRQRDHVQHRKELLRQHNVGAPVGEVIESGVRVHMRGRVDQGASAAFDLGIVSLSGDELGNLLHVRDPVNLGV